VHASMTGNQMLAPRVRAPTIAAVYCDCCCVLRLLLCSAGQITRSVCVFVSGCVSQRAMRRTAKTAYTAHS